MYANSARKICSMSSTSSWIRFSPLNVSSWLNACVFVCVCVCVPYPGPVYRRVAITSPSLIFCSLNLA